MRLYTGVKSPLSPKDDDECQQLLPTPSAARRQHQQQHQHPRPRHHLLKSAADLRVRLKQTSTSSSPPDVFHSVDDLLSAPTTTAAAVAAQQLRAADSFHTAAANSLGPSVDTLSTPVLGSSRNNGSDKAEGSLVKDNKEKGHHAIEVITSLFYSYCCYCCCCCCSQVCIQV